MPDRTNQRDEGAESPTARRERESARSVAEWEAAFHEANAEGGDGRQQGDDQANAGAIVSRAHRAEKQSGSANGRG